MTPNPERITSKLDAEFYSISSLNKILLFQLGKDGLEVKKHVLSRYSFNDFVDNKEDFSDSIFKHKILRLATQILLHEMLWKLLWSYMPYRSVYSKKDIKKLIAFFQRGASLK